MLEPDAKPVLEPEVIGLAKPVPEPDNGVMSEPDAGGPEPDNGVMLGPDAGLNGTPLHPLPLPWHPLF